MPAGTSTQNARARGDAFGVAAEIRALGVGDAHAGPQAGHFRTDGLDDADALAPRHERQRARIGAGAHVDVDIVDAGCGLANQQLIRLRYGFGAFGRNEDLGPTDAIDAYDLHATANPPRNGRVSGRFERGTDCATHTREEAARWNVPTSMKTT